MTPWCYRNTEQKQHQQATQGHLFTEKQSMFCSVLGHYPSLSTLCSINMMTRKTEFPDDLKVLYIPMYCGATVCHCHLWQQIPHLTMCTQAYFLPKGGGFPGACCISASPMGRRAVASQPPAQSAAPENISVWDGLWDAGLAPLPASPVPHRKLRFLPQTRHYIGSPQSSRKRVQHRVTQTHPGELTPH